MRDAHASMDLGQSKERIYDLDRDRDLRDFFSGVLDRLRLRLLLTDLLLDFFLSRDRLLSRESLRSEQINYENV